MPYVKETALVGGKEITIETGKWAKLAGGAVVVTCGDTKVLVTACGSAQPREIDFMPLTCEYQEKFYSSGKIPGSFFRREGRQTTDEILVCRLMDRPIRPLFPKGWFIDTQIIANVVSFDKNNPADVLAMTGASAALHISDLVFDGPIAGVRVGHRAAKGVSWFVEGRNLFDKAYASTTGVIETAAGVDQTQFLPGDGRAVYGGIEFRW